MLRGKEKMFSTIQYEVRDQVAWIVLNRPEVLNAFNQQMHEDFYQCLEKANNAKEVRSIVITGNGKGFSVGADLGAVSSNSGEAIDYGDILRKTYNRTIQYMSELKKPTISSINGAAFGAGLGIALATDFRLASVHSTYCLAFIKIGLMPDAGTSYFLPRIIGLSRAMELAASGRTVEAQEAYQIGMINRIIEHDDLQKQTEKMAIELANMPTKAFGVLKQSMLASFENTLPTQLEQEANGQSILGKSRDHLEGVQAFFQKRKATFKGE